MKLRFLFYNLFFTLVKCNLLDEAINNTWRGLIDRNKDQTPFLIHRPYSETPGDAVSEGVGYGLLLSVYNDDQIHFDSLLQGAEETMWNGNYYDWRVDAENQKTGFGGATDAEQDIAVALLLAYRKSKNGAWKGDQMEWYYSRALTIINNLWNNGIQNNIVRPGYQWGGQEFVNVGYFAPAWYRIFGQYDVNHDWNQVVDTSYNIISNSPGYSLGLVPDWMTPDGNYYSNLGYNSYGDGHYLFKDAIRVFWRLGTDYLWFNDSRAYEFLENSYNFIKDYWGGIKDVNFYQMDGKLVPENDIWSFDGGQKSRPRREHSHLTIGMWSFPIGIFGNKTAVIKELLSFYEQENDFWGKTSGNETIDENELYFDQFLANFGALYLADRWNLIE
jgi:endo-1,4-beta-D-glucanase Y